MRMRVILLLLFAGYVLLFGKNQYIQCYNNVIEYHTLYTQIKDVQQKITAIDNQMMQYQNSIDTNSLSWYNNRIDLIEAIDDISNCSIVEISALDINNKQSILYLAKTENLEDVESFTDKINGIEVKLSVNDVSKVLSSLDKLNCMIYRVCIDNTQNEINVQILIIKEKS